MNIVNLKLLLIGVLLVLVVFPAHAARIVMIANSEVVEQVLDEESITRIYQGKLTRWDDDQRIIPVMLKNGPTHESFIEDVMGSTTTRFRTYWKQAVFSGRGIPPKTFESELELVKYVATTPGAIGYVSPITPLQDVKELGIRD